ncbi:MAG: leucyl aminopeptidase [Planctomycetaceae bacterium]|nr:leucyl aminopeptidase [Planctomycetaceae bacterium]
MKTIVNSVSLLLAIALLAVGPALAEESNKPPAETKLTGPEGVSLIVRMQGPYDADVPLQIVCYFKRTPNSDARFVGAPVELDKRLGGIIESLRARGEFIGDELETFLLDAPAETIKPKRLLLIGLGDEASLSLERMEKVGRVALREAVRMGVAKVAFAPLIKDAGNNKLPAGDVENAVVRGMLLAYDTEKRLQKQGFAQPYTLDTWVIEAGPTYYDETIAGVKKAALEATESSKKRGAKPYSTKSK